MIHDFSYEAVIFDLDGVLANTEPGIFRIHQDVISAYGPMLGSADHRALYGLDFADSAVYLVKTYGLPETPARIAQILHDAVFERISDILEPIPCSQELIHALNASGKQLGLASNSPCDYVRQVVFSLGLASIFPAPVCRDDVRFGKPAPDPYLEACRRLGADPRHSLAVEDSPAGMRSALSAGLDFAVVGGHDHQEMPDRAFYFNSITELLESFRSAAKA